MGFSSLLGFVFIIGLFPLIIQKIIIVPLSCCFVFAAYKSTSYFSSFFSNKIIVYLGEISFSVYMVHMFLVQFFCLSVYPKISQAYQPSFLLIYKILSIPMVILISALLYEFLEVPSRKFLRNLPIKLKNSNYSILKSRSLKEDR